MNEFMSKSSYFQWIILIGFCGGLLFSCSQQNEQQTTQQTTQQNMDKAYTAPSQKLRHVVLFKFKEGVDPAAIRAAEQAFAALPEKIPEIMDFEWGLNNSPEGLDKGFTHCYFLTFASEEDRAVYLPHPDHQAFGALLTDILEDVTVVDYWVK